MQRLNWNDLQHLLAISRAGTLAAAARRLAVDQTTVARRLTAAEAALKARLFDRVDGLFRPTAAGMLMLRQAERIEQELETVQQSVAGSDERLSGSVRLTAVPIIVNHLLVPGLPTLLARYPRLRLELIAEPRNLSLSNREADIALRLARPHGSRLLARRIGRLDYAVFGAGSRNAAELPWITYEVGMAELPQARWIAAAGEASGDAILRVNDAEAVLQAVAAGLGKSLLPCFLAEAEPRLRRLGGLTPVLSREIWLIVHPALRRLARIGAVIDWLETTLPRRHA